MLEIKRTLKESLQNHMSRKEITLLIGPRQAGKTSLLKEIANDLREKGEPILFYNLDIERDRTHFTGQENFIDLLKAITGGQKHFVFIDEIQRLENAGLFLKGLYDRDLPHKLIVTGSGSLELKEKIAESLVGRKRSFYLYTVSPAEYAAYYTDYQFQDRIGDVLHYDKLLAGKILRDYLKFGGYPAVITEETETEKLRTLAEIYEGYIERDIKALLALEKSSAFVMLLRLMANRSGYPVNYSDLSKQVQLNFETVKKYLWYSEKTFITATSSPFFTNKDKEIVKAPVYYFLDVGLRNFLRGIYEDPSDRGMRFQTMVYRLLEEKFRHTSASTHFWQTKSKAEVDFVVNRGADLLPVEVKATAMERPKVSRSYRSFLERYTPKEGWIVNSSLRDEIQIDKTLVRFIPWYDLI